MPKLSFHFKCYKIPYCSDNFFDLFKSWYRKRFITLGTNYVSALERHCFRIFAIDAGAVETDF